MIRDCVVVVPVHNRAYYTAMSLPLILDAARACPRIQSIHLVDDRSGPETRALLDDVVRRASEYTFPVVVHDLPEPYQNTSTGALRLVLNAVNAMIDCQFIAKVDNDILIPPVYFWHLLQLLDANAHHRIGFLGMKETSGFPVYHEQDTLDLAPHIGGVGIFRREALTGADWRPYRRFFGFTEIQMRASHAGWKAAWTSISRNTNLDLSPWACVDSYVETGEGRKIPGNPSQSIWTGAPFAAPRS